MAQTPAPTRVRLPRTTITSLRAHLGLAALSAVLLGLSFPEPGWWPLAYVALVPVGVLAVRSGRPRRLLWTSYLVNVAWWLVMVRWIWPVTAGGHVGMSAVLALYPTAAVGGLYYLHRKYGSAMVLALPLVWVSVEFLRGHLPEGGFGWFVLAHTQAPVSPEQAAGRIVQVADLFGEMTVSFVVAMVNGFFVDLLTRPLVRHVSGGRVRLRRTIGLGAALGALTLLAAWLYGQWRIAQFDEATEPGPRVAVVQTNVPQDNKNAPTPEQTLADWQAMVALTEAAANATDPALIVWPETMVPVPLNPEALAHYNQQAGGESEVERFHRQIQALAHQAGAIIIAGSHAYEDWRRFTDERGTYEMPTRRFNAVYLYHADGVQAPQHYDKMHLVPFGEYIPWIRSSDWLKHVFINYLSPYPFDYSLVPGARPVLFEVAVPVDEAQGEAGSMRTLRLATPICFEDAVPRVTRRLVYSPGGQKQADAILNLTNSAWYPGSHQQAQHLQIAVLRSIENRVPTARSVNYGISGFIDSVGRVGPLIDVDGRRTDVAGFVADRLTLDQRETVFGHLGEVPAWIMVGVTASLMLGGLLRRDKIGD